MNKTVIKATTEYILIYKINKSEKMKNEKKLTVIRQETNSTTPEHSEDKDHIISICPMVITITCFYILSTQAHVNPKVSLKYLQYNNMYIMIL